MSRLGIQGRAYDLIDRSAGLRFEYGGERKLKVFPVAGTFMRSWVATSSPLVGPGTATRRFSTAGRRSRTAGRTAWTVERRARGGEEADDAVTLGMAGGRQGIGYVRHHAATWSIYPQCISMVGGFAAGSGVTMAAATAR